MERKLLQKGIDYLLHSIYDEEFNKPHFSARVDIVAQNENYAKIKHDGIALHIYKGQNLDVDYRSLIMSAEGLPVYDAGSLADDVQYIMVDEEELEVFDEAT